MIEVAHALQWILQQVNDVTVTTAGAAGFWHDVVPDGEPFPAVVVGLQSGNDTNSASAYRLLTDSVFYVRAVGFYSDFDRIVAIADAFDTKLDRVVVSAFGVNMLMCVRTHPIITTQRIENVLYSYVGGLYNIEVNKGQ